VRREGNHRYLQNPITIAANIIVTIGNIGIVGHLELLFITRYITRERGKSKSIKNKETIQNEGNIILKHCL
jgi:hypothetical protein